jgi:hypothetical protein
MTALALMNLRTHLTVRSIEALTGVDAVTVSRCVNRVVAVLGLLALTGKAIGHLVVDTTQHSRGQLKPQVLLGPQTQSQQDFLRAAMGKLVMTRNEFAARLGCARRTLDKWLLPTASNDFREMDETIWNLVHEILAHEKLKRVHAKVLASANNLRASPKRKL